MKSSSSSASLIQLFSIQNADRTMEIFRIRSEDEIKRGITKRTKRLKDKGLDEQEILESLQSSEISMLITPFTTVRTMAKIKSACWTNNIKKLDILMSLTNNSIEYHTIPVPETLKGSTSRFIFCKTAYN